MWNLRNGKHRILSITIVAAIVMIAGASMAAAYNLVGEFIGSDDIIRACVETDGSHRLISSKDSCTGSGTAIQ